MPWCEDRQRAEAAAAAAANGHPRRTWERRSVRCGDVGCGCDVWKGEGAGASGESSTSLGRLRLLPQ